jgi:serine/threonine-protein kinase
VRDGARAKDAATRACELTEWRDAPTLDTLAAACAELGEWPLAVQWMTEALRHAPPDQQASYQARRDDYARKI